MMAFGLSEKEQNVQTDRQAWMDLIWTMDVL